MRRGTYQVVLTGDEASVEFYDALYRAGIEVSFADSTRIAPGTWRETFTVTTEEFVPPSSVAKFGPWVAVNAPIVPTATQTISTQVMGNAGKGAVVLLAAVAILGLVKTFKKGK